MKINSHCFALIAALLAVMHHAVLAQAGPPTFVATPIQTPDQSGAIALYPGKAPGSESASHVERWEDLSGQRIVRNVTRPLLIPVLPIPGKFNGQTVVIAPGGGYQFLSFDTEGLMAARLLAEQGVAAFVLKYRTDETRSSSEDFSQDINQMFRIPVDKLKPLKQPLALADLKEAIRLVRQRSKEWGIDPGKVGFLGFSAGAITGQALLQINDRSTMPSFAALIYGPMLSLNVPADAPPLFVSMAADDQLFGSQSFGLIDSWRKAGGSVELHVYENGGHGFGMTPRGAASDQWFTQFLNWLSRR